MHNGMVQLDEEKMSKSIGNIRSLSGALDARGRDALVMYFAGGHYRQPLAFSEEALEEARRSVERVRELIRRLNADAGAPEGMDEYVERFFDALADDFQTPAARAVLFEWVTEANRRLDSGQTLGFGRLSEMLYALGLEGLLEAGADEEAPDPEALQLLQEREEARAGRDFATADARRDELAARGYDVRDTPQGPRLVRRG
jgi:cysteinyl-tRNA synthetase